MRIRTIKPEFWRSDDITVLDIPTRLLFIGIWSYVDDNGVGIDDERRIAADLFGLEPDPMGIREMVRDGLATLSRGCLIVRYRVGGRGYLAVSKWSEHQKIDKPGKARYPSPPHIETVDFIDSEGNDVTESGNPRDSLASISRLEQGNRGTGEQGNREEPSSADADPEARISEVRDDVERLCSLLADLIESNKSKRPPVTVKWRRSARLMLDTDGRTEDQVERAIRWCQADEFWRANILSMPKLREKYDQLRLAAQRSTVVGKPSNDTKVAATLAMAERFEQGNYSPRELTDGYAS